MTRRAFFALLLAFASHTFGADTLRVGVKIAEPFVVQEADGEWSGLAYWLWQSVARDLGYEFVAKEYDLAGLLDAVERGEIDVAVAPLTVTAERSAKMDFTQPFFIAGLSVAAPAEREMGLLGYVRQLITVEMIEAIVTLVALLIVVALAMWLVERRRNPEQFGGGAARGIGEGVWWAAVTMTTVGYGDRAPTTGVGRTLAFVWMLVGIMFISSLTAAIASALTVSRLSFGVENLADLRDRHVGVVEGSAAERALQENRVAADAAPTIEDLFDRLEAGDLDAVVYDAPIVRHQIKKRNLVGKIKTVDLESTPGYFAFALPLGSPLRKPLDAALLLRINDDEWRRLRFQYFGE
ncbi:MAG: transporter substrate-binding domain-containing protein [Ignavibacteriales bacterium]|nr:transporter substrate-binding domain-containing protein [Ignavibacteriales bacterium]